MFTQSFCQMIKGFFSFLALTPPGVLESTSGVKRFLSFMFFFIFNHDENQIIKIKKYFNTIYFLLLF